MAWLQAGSLGDLRCLRRAPPLRLLTRHPHGPEASLSGLLLTHPPSLEGSSAPVVALIPRALGKWGGQHKQRRQRGPKIGLETF